VATAAFALALLALFVALVVAVADWTVLRADEGEEREYREEVQQLLISSGEEMKGVIATAVMAEREDRAADIAAAKIPPARPPVTLDPNERLQLQDQWRAGLICPHCGWMHHGVCPRVAKVTTERRGAQIIVTTEYWPNDKWELPADALSGRDLWEGAAPPPQQQGATDGTSTAGTAGGN
jgi:hypothetical protein